MGYFLLILFLVFVLPPIIRGIVAVHRFRRQTRDAFEAMYGAGKQGRPDARRERKAGWSDSGRQKKKKINKDVGEYIAFEEITVEQTVSAETDGRGQATYEVEQQVSDAEWEEITK